MTLPNAALSRRTFLSGLALCGLLPACAQAQPPAGRRFRVFDGTYYERKPDLAQVGIEPIHIVDRGIWADGQGANGRVDPNLVRAYLNGLPNDRAPVVLDFEMYPQHGEPVVRRDSLGRLVRIAQTFRAAGSGRQMGYFGILPIAENNRPLHPGAGDYRDWQSDNDFYAPIEAEVDCLFPSLYTDRRDRDAWLTLATSTLSEARRMSSKPVYGFLWPEYHDNNKEIGGQFIEADFWQLQLQTLYRHADGIAIWGGFNMQANGRRRQWDENAPWWQTTRRFLRDIGLAR